MGLDGGRLRHFSVKCTGISSNISYSNGLLEKLDFGEIDQVNYAFLQEITLPVAKIAIISSPGL